MIEIPNGLTEKTILDFLDCAEVEPDLFDMGAVSIARVALAALRDQAARDSQGRGDLSPSNELREAVEEFEELMEDPGEDAITGRLYRAARALVSQPSPGLPIACELLDLRQRLQAAYDVWEAAPEPVAPDGTYDPFGTKIGEEEYHALADEFRAKLSLYAQPILEYAAGSQPSPWNYDMGQAPLDEDLILSVRIGKKTEVVDGPPYYYGDAWVWSDDRGTLGVPYAWMRKLSPAPDPLAAPTLPNGEEQGRG